MTPRLVLSLLLVIVTVSKNAIGAQPEPKAVAIYAPYPTYPLGAQYRHSSGAGLFLRVLGFQPVV